MLCILYSLRATNCMFLCIVMEWVASDVGGLQNWMRILFSVWQSSSIGIRNFTSMGAVVLRN